jgi:hypothetical protein
MAPTLKVSLPYYYSMKATTKRISRRETSCKLNLDLHKREQIKVENMSLNIPCFDKKVEFYYVSEVSQRYLIFLLISVVNFYYVINKLIILIYVSH